MCILPSICINLYQSYHVSVWFSFYVIIRVIFREIVVYPLSKKTINSERHVNAEQDIIGLPLKRDASQLYLYRRFPANRYYHRLISFPDFVLFGVK